MIPAKPSRTVADRAWPGLAMLLWLGLCWTLPTHPQPLLPDQFNDGRRAYDAGDFKMAEAIWRPMANRGDPRAQFAMGTLYYEGAGLDQDLAQSAQWFRQAAEQGLAAAQYNLGNAFRYGYGVTQDDAEAIVWWKLASEQGLASASYNIGTQYYFGRGVAYDEAEAFRWYRKAAEQGHEGAAALFADDQTATASAQPEAARPGATRPAPPPAAEAPGPTAPQATEPVLHGADWLMSRSPSHFTLQLAAMREEVRVSRFIVQHRLTGEMAYFRMERDGRELFVLVNGDFPDRGAASAAISQLPERVRQGSPWPRSFAEIQALVRQGR